MMKISPNATATSVTQDQTRPQQEQQNPIVANQHEPDFPECSSSLRDTWPGIFFAGFVVTMSVVGIVWLWVASATQ